MERDWKRLGRALADARETLGLSQVQAAEQLHVSRTPIQAIERGRQSNGKPFTKVTNTMRAYARLVGWTESSPDAVLDGDAPTPQAAPQPPEPAASGAVRSNLPPAVELELRSGETLDSAVIHLGGDDDDDDTRIIVVLKGAEGMSEEELDRRWQQYRKARRHLQGVASETENPQET
jgi:DNA-binding XRE family transcriptional regulator